MELTTSSTSFDGGVADEAPAGSDPP